MRQGLERGGGELQVIGRETIETELSIKDSWRHEGFTTFTDTLTAGMAGAPQVISRSVFSTFGSHGVSRAKYNLTEPTPLKVEYVAVEFIIEPFRPPSPSLSNYEDIRLVMSCWHQLFQRLLREYTLFSTWFKGHINITREEAVCASYKRLQFNR